MPHNDAKTMKAFKRWLTPFTRAQVCFGLLVALTTMIFSGTLLAQPPEKPKRNLLFIGQAKGYQHESISTAMATLHNLGRSSGLWNTYLRTDCTAITKKPLKWEAKNLDAFDAVVFFTDGELDMDASQKADLLSFVRDDGKGFIGIHSAAITFRAGPNMGRCSVGISTGIRGACSMHPSWLKIRAFREWEILQPPSNSRTRFTRSRIFPERICVSCCVSIRTNSI